MTNPFQFLALLLAVLFVTPTLFGQSDTCLLQAELGISFPPVANQMQRDFSQPLLNELGVKRIRIGEDWSLREPTPGSFNWGPLDDRLAWAAANDYKILLTIQSRGPAWVCGAQNGQSCVFSDNADFRNYLDSLLTRYPNQIDKIQFGNEWQTNFWYVGNASEFIASHNTLYDAVQMHAPTTDVVLGGFTTSSLRFLAGCNGVIDSFVQDDGILVDSTILATNCNSPTFTAASQRIDSILGQTNYDVLDLHLYDDVELWPALLENFTDTITKPIIISEFGGL